MRRAAELSHWLQRCRYDVTTAPNIDSGSCVDTVLDTGRLQSASEHYIVAKHRNLVHNYVDDLTFKLMPCGAQQFCQVFGIANLYRSYSESHRIRE
ncbi:unnamed protein product [Ranitomeya imitator]|uniref:Uncharacterized protein n=1 Tax=Ranitomeya imitator TaxID=111125 RepID=A0ABN9MFX4_9NEOB|nr:unnamed protein product [Ranitomeya imitator]